MSETPEQIICLNYCMPDHDTGYCLTCGRPPIPLSAVGVAGSARPGGSCAADETPDQEASAGRPAGQ